MFKEKKSESKELRLKLSTVFLKLVIWYAIFCMVNQIWVDLEYMFYGSPQPNNADTVILFILVFSLYFNLRKYLTINGR